MSRSTRLGMRTFDQSLYELYESGYISYEDALRNADSKNELRLRIKLESRREHVDAGDGGLTLERRDGRGQEPVNAVSEDLLPEPDEPEVRAAQGPPGANPPRRPFSTPSRCSS